MTNAFAYRSTDPNVLKTLEDPVGPENDRHLQELSAGAGVVIVAWGFHGALNGRQEDVLKLLKDPQYLALTKDGNPRHPLYLRADLRPKPYPPKGGRRE